MFEAVPCGADLGTAPLAPSRPGRCGSIPPGRGRGAPLCLQPGRLSAPSAAPWLRGGSGGGQPSPETPVKMLDI